MGGPTGKQDDPSQHALCSLIFTATMVCLTGTILGFGLNGKFGYAPGTFPEAGSGVAMGSASMSQQGSSLRFPSGTGSAGTAQANSVVTPQMTDGTCLVNVSPQATGFTESWCQSIPDSTPVWGNAKYPACYPLGVPEWHPTENIIVTLPNPAECDVAVSDTWRIAGWFTTYVQLAPGAVFTPPPPTASAQSFIKIYRGSLLDVGNNGILRDDGRWETFVVTPPLGARSMRVPLSTDSIEAGSIGAAFVFFMAPTELLETPVTDMMSGPASIIEGPYSELLEWRTFRDRTGHDIFSEEFWNLAGILINEYDGSRLCYNQWWTVREDDPVDGGYHDHTDKVQNNTFAELHMTMYAATASAGMQTQLPHTMNLRTDANPSDVSGDAGQWYARNDDPEVQMVIPMPPGYAHGPLWAVDPETRGPQMNCEGGVVYPFHRLVLGTGADGDAYHNPPRYQLWVAFEHPPQHTTVPEQMLAKWSNAYLQTEDGNLPAGCQDLPQLRDNICDLDTIYNGIRTGNVVETTLDIRRRDCPSNRGNQPCAVDNFQGDAPGPILDGVRAPVYTINDSSPAPTIRANLGDTIRVTVRNFIGEPTTMHFHGMTQFRTPYADGDEMVSNCPIQFGQTYTYEFIAHPAGSTFYHSHVGSQRQMGLTGALIVVDPREETANVDRELLISDWWHESADQAFNFWAQNVPPGGYCITFGGPRFTGPLNPASPIPNFVGAVVGDGKLFTSVLVNGRGIYDWAGTQIPKNITLNDNDMIEGNTQTFDDMLCPGQSPAAPECEFCPSDSDWSVSAPCDGGNGGVCGQAEVVEVQQGNTVRLRLLQSASLFAFQVCVDAHPLSVIAADGQPTTPYPVDCILVSPGERYDVSLQADMPPGDYAIRFLSVEQKVSADFSGTDANYPNDFGPDTTGFPNQGIAILRYSGGTTAGSSLMNPPACSAAITRNCGPDYWLSSTTLGCAFGPSIDDPSRCFSAYDLEPASYPDAEYCGDMLMGHEVAPNVRISTPIHWLPDEVPRWEATALSARMEIIPEEEGWPFVTPAGDFGAHSPISFIAPSQPTLSLSKEARDQLYAFRDTFRPPNLNNPSELPPNYPEGFSTGIQGPNTLSLEYGDVVRLFLNCTEPYGPGCAMPHPMHLHGHKMAVLAHGRWNQPYSDAMIKTRPLYRDTFVAHTDGWVVVQFVAKNPGVWRFHCHVNIHHRGGMAMLFDVGGTNDAAMDIRRTPPAYDLC